MKNPMFAVGLAIILVPGAAATVAPRPVAIDPSDAGAPPGPLPGVPAATRFVELFMDDPNSNGRWNIHRALGDAHGEASWDATTGDFYLARAGDDDARAALALANTELDSSRWQAVFEYRSAGGPTDGFVFFFERAVADPACVPATGAGLGFDCGPPELPGYGLAFTGERVLLFQGTTAHALAGVVEPRASDGRWHTASVLRIEHFLRFTLDGDALFETTLRPADGVGVGFSGSAAHPAAEHAIASLVLAGV